jgi:hypothetical protein
MDEPHPTWAFQRPQGAKCPLPLESFVPGTFAYFCSPGPLIGNSINEVETNVIPSSDFGPLVGTWAGGIAFGVNSKKA